MKNTLVQSCDILVECSIGIMAQFRIPSPVRKKHPHSMVPVRCAFIPYETMVSGVFETMGMGFTALIIGEYPPVAMVSVNINE